MVPTPAPSTVAELLKPTTWFAPMRAFACGVVSSGQPARGRWPVIAADVLLAGPPVCATSQATPAEGDRRMGLASLPVQTGSGTAARFACVATGLPQLAVIAPLLSWDRIRHAGGFAGLLLAGQPALMARLLKDPRERAAWYDGAGTTLYALGMPVPAFASRPLVGGA